MQQPDIVNLLHHFVAGEVLSHFLPKPFLLSVC